MLISSKASKMHTGKIFEMRSGINGSGKDITVIQTIINNICTWQENFTSAAEAASWFKYSCQ